jgi:hypothetical protein
MTPSTSTIDIDLDNDLFDNAIYYAAFATVLEGVDHKILRCITDFQASLLTSGHIATNFSLNFSAHY